MKNNRIRATCCGGGGGRIWLNDLAQRKLNNDLVGRAIKNHTRILASACPLCLTRLDEAAAGMEANLDTLDIAELIEHALA